MDNWKASAVGLGLANSSSSAEIEIEPEQNPRLETGLYRGLQKDLENKATCMKHDLALHLRMVSAIDHGLDRERTGRQEPVLDRVAS